jgi:putative transposase
MAVNLIRMFAKLLSWMVLHARSDTANEIEILVLRHQLAVLRRRTPRPQIRWSDRAVIAALTRLLPACRRRGLLVTPATILRWHRDLVRRRWTTPDTPPGRPAIPAGVRALIVPGCFRGAGLRRRPCGNDTTSVHGRNHGQPR